MRKLLVAPLALLMIMGDAGTAFATPVGNPFMRGIKGGPSELAEMIEKNLALHPDGKTKLSEERCRNGGSCAAPINYLIAFQRLDPSANLKSVHELPQFLRDMKIAEGPSGKFSMNCLVPSQRGGWEGKFKCLARPFKAGEHIWISRTGKGLLAEDCTNPIDGPEKPAPAPDCVEVKFTTKPQDDVVRIAVFGPQRIDDVCGPSIHRAASNEYDRGWLEECPDISCNFNEIKRAFKLPAIQWKTSYRVQPGEHVIRLPRYFAAKDSPYRVFLCLDRDGKHSDGIGVQWFDYLPQGKTKVATVWYAKAQVKTPSVSNLYWPWGEWNGR